MSLTLKLNFRSRLIKMSNVDNLNETLNEVSDNISRALDLFKKQQDETRNLANAFDALVSRFGAIDDVEEGNCAAIAANLKPALADQISWAQTASPCTDPGKLRNRAALRLLMSSVRILEFDDTTSPDAQAEFTKILNLIRSMGTDHITEEADHEVKKWQSIMEDLENKEFNLVELALLARIFS